MRKVTALVTVAAGTLALAAHVAFAQTGDAVPDGNGHPNVGALLMPRADGSLRIICSGTLVTPRVFLTASHCTSFEEESGFTRSYVTFDANFGTDPNHDIFTTPYAGTIVTNPDYKPPYNSDVSLILLDEPVTGITPAQIAPLHLLDELKDAHALNDLAYTNVGYGTSEQVVVKGTGPTFPFDGIRKVTVSGYHALDRQFIHLDQNLARGLSGTGYGDSGGPTFIDTESGPVVISVVSSGDVPLYSTSVNSRIDTGAVQAFLAPYLARH
jgi:V8-like Glu-specific endopeptidase